MPMKKFIRKPYAGKPHVRIDEGAGRSLRFFPALLYWIKTERTYSFICYICIKDNRHD